MTVHSDEVGRRVRRLLEFLRETVSAQSKPVRAYGPTTRIDWLYRRDRDVQVDANATAGDVIVRVGRVSVESPPQLPEQLVDSVQGPVDRAADRRHSRAEPVQPSPCCFGRGLPNGSRGRPTT